MSLLDLLLVFWDYIYFGTCKQKPVYWVRERKVMCLCPISFPAMCLQSRELEEQAPSSPLEFLSFFLFFLFGFPLLPLLDKANFTPLLLLPFPQQHSGWSPESMMFVLMTLCCGRAWWSPQCDPDPFQGTLLCLWGWVCWGPQRWPKLVLKSFFHILWCRVNLLGWLQASSE